MTTPHCQIRIINLIKIVVVIDTIYYTILYIDYFITFIKDLDCHKISSTCIFNL